ncbi:MAG: peroxiredoxin family protein, partial [Planctomycetaceae bacterium]|nr:peroxiredoxin family protein [Planctomycetaceae bacterium]
MSELSKRLQAGAVLTSLLVAGAAGSGGMQQVAAADSFQLPDQPAAWVNSPPISLSALKGKAAVLWFYEEQCPKCKEKWPALQAAAKQFEGKPIVFIAVSSGTSRFEVEQYAREVGLKWPVIVDSTRQFEQLCDIGEISLQNIHQLGMILPSGQFQQGDWKDVPAAAEKALADAKWKVDPAGVPSTLKAAWLAVEFGNPAAAATAVKKALNSPKADIQEAAGKLHEAVQTEAQESITLAEQWLEGNQPWEAYKVYAGVKERFGNYDLPTDVAAKLKELEADSKVKNEVAANKALEAAAKLL